MVQKIFNRFGLRREFNLSDLTDSTAALNNILSTPSMLGTEESFTSNDLEPIFGVFLTNITLSTFTGLSGTTVTFTKIDDNGIITDDIVVYRPLIKIKTQLDSSFFSSGEPFFFGGDGPNAFYYDSDNIVRDPEPLDTNQGYSFGTIVLSNGGIYRALTNALAPVQLTPETAGAYNFEFIRDWNGIQDIFFNDELDPVTNEVTTISDRFWERGQFAFTSKIQTSFLSLFGGVNWKGFYKPTSFGTTEFFVSSTGSTIFKFQNIETFSFQQVRYGKPDVNIINTFKSFIANPALISNRYSLNNIENIVGIYDDPTRELVQVTLPRKQKLSNDDFIFLEVSEGQVKSRRYNALTHRSGVDNTGNGGVDERYLIYFFIEVTKDFNILNVDINTLPLSGTGSSEDLANGNITEATTEVLSGLLATIRYSPYKSRDFDTYLYSTTHKLEIPPATYTVSGNTITCDDFYYKHLMQNDYIYDYRRRTTDAVQSVRRFVVNSLDDSTNTATVSIDPTYTINNNSPNNENNDQFYYIIQGNTSVSGTYDGLVENPGLFLEKSWNDNTSSTMVVFSGNNVTFNSTNTAITTENMGVTGATQTYFEENNEYLVRFTNSDSVYRTFNYILHGAPGGNTNGGSGAKIEGNITFRRNIWYKIVIGKSGELEGFSDVGGGGAAGINTSTSVRSAYSGGGYSGIHDLDLPQSNVNGSTANQEPLTQENMVVIAAGGGGGTSTSGGGGDAGTPTGSDGTGSRGGGGGGTIGGSGGSGGVFSTNDGSALQGGAGQSISTSNRYAGAGGGGGYFGGGGGGNQNTTSTSSTGGGGGGGSAISVSSLTVTKTESVGSEKITNVVTSGTIGDTIDLTLNGIDELVFVGRYGEDITRQKRIVVNYSLEEYVDYAFDWAFYIKDEDINSRSNNKIWTISKREQINPNFQTLNYKFLYGIDYDFFKIGDFKNFAENSMFTNGTSRETGVNQLAFGKPQLLDKGDQYNVFYNLLPIISTYHPPLNFNTVVKTGNGNVNAKSRVLSSSQFTDFVIGNYVIDNTLDSFRGDATSIIPRGTRVIEIPSSGFTNIVLSKTIDTTVNSQPYAVIDHRGFICTCTLQPTGTTPSTIAGSDVIIRGQSNEIKVGMVLCVQDQPSKSTYTRITSISEDANGDTIVTLDSDLLSTNEIGAIVYTDRGVDIVEPLREFCGDSICGQNNFQGSKPKTKYISTIAHVGARNDSLDIRWRESSLVSVYDSDDPRYPHRRTYFPGGDGTDVIGNSAVNFTLTANQGPSVAWWVDANVGQTIDDQAVLSNGATNSPNVSTGRGSKRYGSMQVWARFKKTGAGAYTTGIANAIIEKYPSFPIDDTFWPIGIAEALVRVNGDLRTNTEITNSHKYYFIVRVNEQIKSVPNAQNGYTATWTDSTTASDGNTLLPVTLDLTEFSTDLWDLREIVYPQGTNQNNMRDFFTSLSSESQLNSQYTNMFNNRTNSAYRDHYYRIIGANGFTISQTSAEDKFLNPNSLIRDDGNGNITYELRPGEILAHIGDTGYWTHFDTLESAVDTQVAFTFKPDPIDGGINNQSANESELINLFPGVGGKSATFNNLGSEDQQLRFMQYRDKVYEILPNPTVIENRFTGIRMINPNTQSTYTRPDGTTVSVETNLQNSTNSLSVYAFTSTTDLKELCCPPLDTSPPFDSSEIGLSTTQSNPDMNIDGLVNIRSFSGNHPIDKILSIVTATNSDLPVTEKIELLFGNEKYKLLIGDSIPGTL